MSHGFNFHICRTVCVSELYNDSEFLLPVRSQISEMGVENVIHIAKHHRVYIWTLHASLFFSFFFLNLAWKSWIFSCDPRANPWSPYPTSGCIPKCVLQRRKVPLPRGFSFFHIYGTCLESKFLDRTIIRKNI